MREQYEKVTCDLCGDWELKSVDSDGPWKINTYFFPVYSESTIEMEQLELCSACLSKAVRIRLKSEDGTRVYEFS